MPVLSTFGGASARSFGRAIEVQPPIFPAGTAVWWYNDVSAGLPSGWQYLQEADQQFIVGTNTNSEIGTNQSLAGSVTFNSITSLLAGSHVGPEFSGSRFGTSGTYSQPDGTEGNHSHSLGGSTLSLSSTASYSGDDPYPDYVDMPIIYTDTTQSVLPPNAIVFRGSSPTSSNYQSLLGLLNPSRTCVFRCAQTRVENTPYSRYINYTNSASSGNHRHPNQGRTSGSLTNTVYVYNSTSQNHTHPVKYAMIFRVKNRHLETWVSQFQESLENGMIVMYLGAIPNIPSGWRLCNGNNNTPDMGAYYVGTQTNYDSGRTHGEIIDSSSSISVSGAELEEITWTHTHKGSSFTTSSSSSGVMHDTTSIVHSHSVSSTTLNNSWTSTGYRPPSFQVCFIQYKGL
jgi:hypothetical protein